MFSVSNLFGIYRSLFVNGSKRYAHPHRLTCVRPVPAICSSKANEEFIECVSPHEKYKVMQKLKLKDAERKKIEARNVFISMWENPECCKEVCKKLPIRHDAIYWKLSDKYNCEYQQTWVECLTKKVPHVKCCFEEPYVLEHEKRDKSKKPKTACEFEKLCPVAPESCRKVTMPGCRKVRSPVKCFIIRRPSDCCKVCTPYPAYSECLAPKRRPLRPVECNCRKAISMCEIYRLLNSGAIQLVKRRKPNST